MSRCLLLVLLSSWSLLVAHSLQCETGVAFVDSILSVPRSLMANADVAFLKSYNATSIKHCMEDCCDGKYGACSVASFKKNTTKENCLHFNCRPIPKCKFLPSPSTDSFSFSANPTSPKPVPSDHPKGTSSTPRPSTLAQLAKQQPPAAKEDIAVFEDEQFALKNDNTTVKPRKGVDDPIPDDLQRKSGIKPRKGVSLDDVPHSQFLLNSQNKSNVKARKGVGPYSTTADLPAESLIAGRYSSSSVVTDYSVTPTQHYSTVVTDDLMADLAKILEDDSVATESWVVTATSTPYTPQEVKVTPSRVQTISSTVAATTQSTSIPLFSSEPGSSRETPESSSSRTPAMQTLPVFRQTTVSPSASVGTEPPVIAATTTWRRPPTTQTLNAEYTRVEQEVTLDKLVSTEEETDNDRKYKSSIHLVLSLVFGLLVLFAVLGVVAKRVYDGWLRRDYYRMNYLIDGIYNGVE